VTFTRLLSVEARRYRARRLVRFFVLLALVGIAIAGLVVFVRSHRTVDLSGPAVSYQRQAFDQCLSGDFGVPPTDPNIRAECQMIIFGDPRFHLTMLNGVFQGVTVPLALLAWLLAASFAGAEWHAGTVGTLLTWEPRRIRVLAAKAVACFVLTFAASIALLAILGLALAPAAALRGTTAEANAAWFRGLVGVTLRSALLASLFAAFGMAIASVARNTAAALGVGFAYLLILENLLGVLRPAWRAWMLGANSIILVSGHPVPDLAPGRSVFEAGVLLAAYALGALGLAALDFRRRDVL
jgi:ABC-2 type transport system permease protein